MLMHSWWCSAIAMDMWCLWRRRCCRRCLWWWWLLLLQMRSTDNIHHRPSPNPNFSGSQRSILISSYCLVSTGRITQPILHGKFNAPKLYSELNLCYIMLYTSLNFVCVCVASKLIRAPVYLHTIWFGTIVTVVDCIWGTWYILVPFQILTLSSRRSSVHPPCLLICLLILLLIFSPMVGMKHLSICLFSEEGLESLRSCDVELSVPSSLEKLLSLFAANFWDSRQLSSCCFCLTKRDASNP